MSSSKETLYPYLSLNQKIIEIIKENLEEQSVSGLSRLDWENNLREAIQNKQSLLVIMIDICGRSCGRTNRNFPKIRKKITKITSQLGVFGEVTSGRHQPGSDELILYIGLKSPLRQSPQRIFLTISTSFNPNPNQMMTYVSGLYLPPGVDYSSSQILATLDQGLNKAKKQAKEKKGPLYYFTKPTEIAREIKRGPKYPDYVSTNPMSDLKKWLRKSRETQHSIDEIHGLLITPKEMKKLNARYGMTQVDQWLIELSKTLSLFQSEDDTTLIVKIGPTFMVLSREPLPHHLSIESQLIEALHQRIPQEVGFEIEPLSTELRNLLLNF